jgi:glycosyltransferase involved in cell wall biosynthesis
MNKSSLEDVSVAVCVRNSASLLEACLLALKNETPECEVVVIDGNSSDNSVEIAKRYTANVFSDEGKGLAHARQMGIDKSSGKYVAFISPDNHATRQLLWDMKKVLENNPKVAAVVPQTQMLEPKNYWERATKYIFDYLINTTGKVDVVGTPCMYPREIVTRIRYDDDITGGCDDTDMSLRLKAAGYELEMIETPNFENNDLDFMNFVSRHKFYGKGDAEFYNKYRPEWTVKRRLQSLTHPFRKYALKGAVTFIGKGKVIYVPALWVATIARYSGWFKRSRTIHEKNA